MHCLKRIDIRGLKGGPVTFDLAPATLLYGPNAAGKTRLVDAILLLVTGGHPDLPRTGDGVMRLAERDEVEVDATFTTPEGDWTFRRAWTRQEVKRGQEKGKIKVSSEVQALGPDGRRYEKKEAEVEILRVAGRPEVVDIARLLNQTDTERRDLLFRLGAEYSGWTASKVNDHLAAEQLKEVEPWQPVKDSLAAWLSREIEAAKERTSATRAKVGQCREAAAKLTEDAGVVEPADVGALRQAHKAAEDAQVRVAEEWKAATKDAEIRLQEARTATEIRRRHQETLDDVAREETQLRAQNATPDTGALLAQIEDIEEGFGGLPALRDSLAQAEQRVRETKAAKERAKKASIEIEATPRAAERKAAQLRAQISEAEREAQAEAARRQDEARRSIDGLRQRRNQVDRERLAAEAKATAAAQEAATAARTRYDDAAQQRQTVADLLDTFDSEPSCPILKCPCAQMKDERVLAALDEQVEAARLAVTQAEADVQRRRSAGQTRVAEALAPIDREIATAEEGLQRLYTTSASQPPTVVSLTAELRQTEEAQRQATEAYDRAHQASVAADDAWAAACDAQERARRAVEDAEAKLRDLRAQLAAAESKGGGETAARLAALAERRRQAEDGLRGPAPDIDGLAQVLEETQARAEEAKAAAGARVDQAMLVLREGEARLRDYQHAAQVRRELAEAEAALDECNRVERAIGAKGLQGLIVRDVLGPFVDTVNRCLGDAGLGAFQVRMEDARGNEVFHLGLKRGETFAPIETLSGGESVVVRASVLVGLATLGKAPWRPLVADKIEQVDRTRREAFISRLVGLRGAGLFDQLLISGCSDTVPAVPGLVVVPVGVWADEGQLKAAA